MIGGIIGEYPHDTFDTINFIMLKILLALNVKILNKWN